MLKNTGRVGSTSLWAVSSSLACEGLCICAATGDGAETRAKASATIARERPPEEGALPIRIVPNGSRRPSALLAHACRYPIDLGDRVRKERLQPTTEIVQSRFAVGRSNDPVLRTFSPAVAQKRARPAVGGKRFVLRVTEPHLGAREHEIRERRGLHASELILRIHVMIAGVDAPVVFDRDALAAQLAVDAQLRADAHMLREQCLHVVDPDLPDVTTEPAVEDPAQEITVIVRIHRPLGHNRVRVARKRLRISVLWKRVGI